MGLFDKGFDPLGEIQKASEGAMKAAENFAGAAGKTAGDVAKKAGGALADANGAASKLASDAVNAATAAGTKITDTASTAGASIGKAPSSEKKEEEPKGALTEERAAGILSAVYDKALDGVPNVSRSVDQFADDYAARYDDPTKAAEELVKYQVLKCGTSGFITGLGGLITLPVTIPANIGSVLYVQMRMVAASAKIGGYDIRSDQVQTLVYICLTGSAVNDVIKDTGIQIGTKTLTAALKKLPGSALVKINQRVGFRLITKFGEKGVINLGKLIPLAGGVIGGAFDVASTTIIAKNAIKLFIENENPDGSQMTEEELEVIENA